MPGQPTADERFPRLSARTRRWTLGRPRNVTIADSGRRVLFLRSFAGDDPQTGLWVVDLTAAGPGEERLVIDPRRLEGGTLTDAEAARRERVRESAAGVVSFSADTAGRRAVTVVGRELLVADVDEGEWRHLPVTGELFDPRLDPSGRRVAMCTGRGLSVIDVETDTVTVVEAEPDDPAVGWGRAEHVAAEEMHRSRGFWWSPDGQRLLVTRVDEAAVATWWIASPIDPARAPRPVRYPAAGTANADVSLWCIDLSTGHRVQVDWDSAEFPYLATVFWPTKWDEVSWPSGSAAVIGVQSRDQRRLQWRRLLDDGSTELLAEDRGDPWLELHPGTPLLVDDGLVRIADIGGGRRLLVDDKPVSPPEILVRKVCGRLGDDIVITGSADDPGAVGVWTIGLDGSSRLIAGGPAVHDAVADGDLLVLTTAGLDLPPRTELLTESGAVRELASCAWPMPPAPRVDRFATASGVQVGVLLPRHHVTGQALPVLVNSYGGPHAQRVVASAGAWLKSQWWADQGFAVVVADGRGTPGQPPAWEHAIHRDLAGPVLDDQVAALHAAAERHAELDLERVAIRGWSFGGYLAALAVLRRPDVFAAAIAGAPVSDWRLYDTHYTERYLGVDPADPAYDESSLLADAPRLDRPLLLIHGLADDNVVAAHTLRLSRALTEAGRPHAVLPLSGVTHMTPQEAVAENLLLLQLEFLRSVFG